MKKHQAEPSMGTHQECYRAQVMLRIPRQPETPYRRSQQAALSDRPEGSGLLLSAASESWGEGSGSQALAAQCKPEGLRTACGAHV